MRIRFETPEANGLRVIEEIPDLKVCRIEGRNGIGKTLAVRLLELISGSQPYATLPHAWKSLKEQLGSATISFEGLPEGEIRILLTPSEWPDEPLSGIDQLGLATLNGESVSLERIRELVHVHRIAGDETLSETVALELAERAADARHLDALVAPTVVAWDTELEDLTQLSRTFSVDELQHLRASEKELSGRSRSLGLEASSTTTKLSAVAEAIVGVTQMRMRRERLARLLSDLEASAAMLAAQERKVSELTEQMAKLSEGRARNEIEGDLRTWTRRHRYRETALHRALVAERQVLRILALTSRPSADERNQMASEARRQAAMAKAELDALDHVGGLKQLLVDLDATLTDAPTAVADEVVVRDPVPLTTDNLRNSIRSRRDELRGVPRSEDVERLFQQARQAEARAERLQRLGHFVETSDHKKRLLDEAVGKIDELWRQVEGSSDIRTAAETLRSEADHRLGLAISVVSAAQALVDLLGTAPIDTRTLLPEVTAEELAEATDEDRIDDLEAAGTGSDPGLAAPADPADGAQWALIAERLDADTLDRVGALDVDTRGSLATIAEIDVVLETLRGIHHVLTEKAREFEDELVIARRDARTARQALTAYTDSSRKSLDEVLTSNRWSSYRSGVASLIGDVDLSDIEAASVALQRLSWFVGRLRDDLSAVRSGLGQLDVYLSAESNRLTNKGDARVDAIDTLESFALPRAQQLRIRRWAEHQLAELVGSVALRNELFDGAEEISVDLRNATVAWESPVDGRFRRRPFEAFSSGEQVFAYTRAKLELLRERPPAADHVIVVLDEFGAFVARDRFGQLMEFVADDALGTVAEQIVVILPLADDYRLDANAPELVAAAEAAKGGVHLHKVAQLAERDYFAVPVMT